MLQHPPGPGTKACSKCGEIKPLNDFHRATGMKDGHRNECRSCWKEICKVRYRRDPKKAIESVQRWRVENPDKYQAWLNRNREENRERRREQNRRGHLRRQYGLTQDAFAALVAAQRGKCAICGVKEDLNLHVDHDHRTKEVRGLLCGKCNKAIGLLNDDPKLVLAAKRYLERRRSRPPSACVKRSRTTTTVASR